MANRPIKNYRAGNVSGAVWFNEREVNGNIVGFKTLSIRRSWMDKEKNIWRDETLNLRRNDIAKVLVILNKIQEDLFLADEHKGEHHNDEDEEE